VFVLVSLFWVLNPSMFRPGSLVGSQCHAKPKVTFPTAEHHSYLLVPSCTSWWRAQGYKQLAKIHNHGPTGNNNSNTCLIAIFGGLWCASTKKDKSYLDLVEQEIASCSGIRWDICKSTPRPRQVTMPAPHHSVFYRPDALPAAQPSKQGRQDAPTGN